ncbi:MAG: type II toxin-antitoxin system VapC family toxin [Alphaproteobacteria bacterium]
MSFVVDASVAIKWYFHEPSHEAAVALLQSGDLLHAPDLIAIEIANIAWVKARKREIEPEQARIVADDIERTIDRLEPSYPLIRRALEIAFLIDHSLYDCLYLACAEGLDATLVTADTRLLRAAEGTAFAALMQPLVGLRLR